MDRHPVRRPTGVTVPGAGGYDLYAGVVGQPGAVRQLRAAAAAPVHAYLLVGPAGVGKRAAAVAFAAQLLCPAGGCGVCLQCRRALAEAHPDLVVTEREGASISVSQVDEIIRVSARTPVEAARKVLLLVDVHLLAQQYPRLLKTLEEPARDTVFLVLAEHVPPELATIASRCVRVDLGPVPSEAVAAALVAEGVEPDLATKVAAASHGRVDRARLLARDEGFAVREAAWAGVPAALDGTGATVAALADRLLASIDSVLGPLRERQAAEVAALEERVRRTGERGAGRAELEKRQGREQRRVRMEELRFGLAALAAAYRDQLVSGQGDPAAAVAAVAAVDSAGAALVRNPNELLLVQGLLVRLTELAEGAAR